MLSVVICIENLYFLVTDLGVLIGKGGLHGNVFRIKPPMCFTKDDAGIFFEKEFQIL